MHLQNMNEIIAIVALILLGIVSIIAIGLSSHAVNRLKKIEAGIEGPPGPQGPQGPQGPDGTARAQEFYWVSDVSGNVQTFQFVDDGAGNIGGEVEFNIQNGDADRPADVKRKEGLGFRVVQDSGNVNTPVTRVVYEGQQPLLIEATTTATVGTNSVQTVEVQIMLARGNIPSPVPAPFATAAAKSSGITDEAAPVTVSGITQVSAGDQLFVQVSGTPAFNTYEMYISYPSLVITAVA